VIRRGEAVGVVGGVLVHAEGGGEQRVGYIHVGTNTSRQGAKNAKKNTEGLNTAEDRTRTKLTPLAPFASLREAKTSRLQIIDDSPNAVPNPLRPEVDQQPQPFIRRSGVWGASTTLP
jgi:hypothetical protein